MKDKAVYLDSAELVATIKSVILELESPIAVNVTNPILDHYDLRARGSKATGHWIFYVTAKGEDEERVVGHA